MVAVFEYEGGAVGTLYYSWEIDAPLKGLRVSKIFGTEGSITFESNGLFLLVNGTRKRLAIPQPTDLLGYRGMFRDFLGALHSGTEPAFTLAHARRDMELLEQIYRTSEKTA